MASESRYDVVVLGAGVIGLTTALELHEVGYKVAVVGRDLPEDTFSTGFASPWAGCNWHTFEDDGSSKAAERDRRTYIRLANVAESHPNLCKKIEFIDVYSSRIPKETKWHRETVGGIREVTGSDYTIPGGQPHAHIWRSYIIHAPNYTIHLAEMAREKGIPVIKTRLSSLDEAYDVPGVGQVDLVVNATGLGSFSLIGVEDKAVHPARGQTVLVRAPRVDRCIMNTESFMGPDSDAKPAYIIPRPANHEVVLGGTYLPDNHSVLPDLDEAERILRACFELEPKLAPEGGTWRDVEVISHNVGLRPARHGGARVELERRRLGSVILPSSRVSGGSREVGVVHAYGFGSAGFQASYGTAEEVVGLVKQYYSRSKGTQARL